ncbi:MAG: hypothetical protein Q7S58_12705 [Candidatus Binatus sp.]|uniref:hypothetical protein n=1 Tax=Candidatus Binatus sp. TaxID=2811406 RepID=UPI00271647F1|nr:hypothetical protein [Candidatus Binatus sp.]MDO8433260.1 hypothetical protein [Candidatus Binatus sp.]
MAEESNRRLLVIGYGSLLSGYGLLGERRAGNSRLIALDAEPVSIHNARRGLAKPSSHGSYLAMDIEPIDRAAPIWASIAGGNSGIGGLLLTFDRESAPMIARREEYSPEAFERLIAIADRAGQPLGEYLLAIARATRFDLLGYRRALRSLLDYTSPGYVFHPVEIDDGRVAIIAIASGVDGSGDPAIRSRREEFAMHRLLSLEDALQLELPGFDRAGQIGYFAECLLGGLHGVAIHDLAESIAGDARCAAELAEWISLHHASERDRFIRATSLDIARYGARFPASAHPSMSALLKLAGVI